MYRNDYGIADVLQLLGISFELPRGGRNSVRIECPFCHTKDFSIDFVKNAWHCFHCGKDEDVGGGMFGLYAHLRGLSSKKEAKDEVEERLFGPADDKQYKRIEINKQRETNYPAKIAIRDIAYKLLLPQLELWSKHRQALYERGLTDQDIAGGQYASVPFGDFEGYARRIKAAGGILSHVPGFLRRSNGNWTLTNVYASGIMIPVVDAFRRIQGIQIRLDDPPDPHHKYRWLSTGSRPSGGKAHGWVHVAGTVSEKAAILTEGPLKANVIHALHEAHPTVLAVPGVNLLEKLKPTLEFAKQKGMTEIVGGFDMDLFKNPVVLLNFFKMDDLIENLGMRIRHMTWDAAYKGFDDYLLACKQAGQSPSVRLWTISQLIGRGLGRYVIESMQKEPDAVKKDIWKRVYEYMRGHNLVPENLTRQKG